MKKRCRVSRNRKSEASKKITKKFIFCIYIYIYIHTRNALFGDFFACHKKVSHKMLTKKSFRVHVICHVGYAFDRSIECWKKNYRSFDQIFSKSENTFSLTAIKFSPVGISYWCNTSFDAESRAEYDPRGYISIGVIFEIL